MQTTSASMAWLFLQENVQVQYLQKIALRAENKWVQSLVTTSSLFIFCVSNFLLPLRQHIFWIERRAIEAQCLQSIFTLSLFLIEATPKTSLLYKIAVNKKKQAGPHG